MIEQANYRALGCAECSQGEALGFDFRMAFQPIVDIRQGVVFAQEALARGLGGESAATVFRHVNPDNQYRFDQTCRVKAIKLAAELGIQSNVSINFMPNAVYKPELCIRTTLNAAQDYGFPAERIIFEFTENERVADPQHLLDIINCYKSLGFKTALDDFGAGYAGLNLLSKVQPDLLKIDMELVRDVHRLPVKQAIVRSIVAMCNDLEVDVVAEGVETAEEYDFLKSLGIHLYQGYYFSKPAFESNPPLDVSLL